MQPTPPQGGPAAPSQSERDRLVYDEIWKREGDIAPAAGFRQLVELLAAALPDGLVADLGCGNGRHAVYAARHGLRAVGVDHSEEAVRQATRRAEDLGDRIEFRQGDAFAWLAAQPDDSLDAIVSFDMIHHRDSSERVAVAALHDMRRALRPGGYLLISLLCDISYSSAERPPGRLFVTADRGRELLAEAFAGDVGLADGREPVYIPGTVSLDPAHGSLVPTDYRATRLWQLIRIGSSAG